MACTFLYAQTSASVVSFKNTILASFGWGSTLDIVEENYSGHLKMFENYCLEVKMFLWKISPIN